MRYPAPLEPGATIGVTSPSSGVPTALRPRLDVAVSLLREDGYDVRVGACMDGSGIASAGPAERAAELMDMLLDPSVRAIVPPWGGELAVEVLPHLDLVAIAGAQPTWVVGFSDVSTLLLPLTTVAGVATVHGQNLMDTPYRVPEGLLSWLDVVTSPAGSRLVQRAATRHRRFGHDDWEADPGVRERTYDSSGGWRALVPGAGPIRASGRLVGGCIETVSILAGTAYGGVEAVAAGGGLLLYLEASEDGAVDIARDLWRIRLAGWFDHANAVLIARTNAPDDEGFTQDDAVRSALAGLDVPVIMDVDCGHVPPHLALVNGAMATVELVDGVGRLEQVLA